MPPKSDNTRVAPADSAYKGQRHIQSITTGLRLLRVIEQADVPISLKDISRQSGMPSGQAHLYLVSLKMAELIVQDPRSSRYSLGPFALQLGMSALRTLDVIELSNEAMNSIRDESGETVYLTIWGNRGPTIISRLDGARPLPMTVRVGHVLPLLASATGKIFLTYLPRSVTEDLIQHELGKSKHSRNAMNEISEIESSVQKKGYAETQTLQSFTGFAGFSAPVFNHASELCATLTVIGPKGQIDVRPNGAVLKLLLKHALDLSRKLGFSGTKRKHL